MSDIQFMEKPDWISWEDICECFHAANVVNDKKGFHMTYSNLTPGKLEKNLKEGDGHCFVALDGNKVVGTVSVMFWKHKWYHWWTRQTVAYATYDAVLPEYRGTDVWLGLDAIRTKCVYDSGVRIRQCNTAEQNKTVIKICKRAGYKFVQYSATGNNANYYSIIMVLWLDGCPYSDKFCNFMFKLSKIIVKTIWKPGYKLRIPFVK